jgi:hypothetical protein
MAFQYCRVRVLPFSTISPWPRSGVRWWSSGRLATNCGCRIPGVANLRSLADGRSNHVQDEVSLRIVIHLFALDDMVVSLHAQHWSLAADTAARSHPR